MHLCCNFKCLGQTRTHKVTYRTHKVTYRTHKVTYRTHKVTYRTHKATYRTDKVTYRTHKATYRTDKVTYRTHKVTYRTDKVTYRTDKVTYRTDKVTCERECVDGTRSEVSDVLQLPVLGACTRVCLCVSKVVSTKHARPYTWHVHMNEIARTQSFTHIQSTYYFITHTVDTKRR